MLRKTYSFFVKQKSTTEKESGLFRTFSKAHNGYESGIISIPNTQHFATCNSTDGEIKFWTCEGEKVGFKEYPHAKTLRIKRLARSLAFTQQGHLVCGSSDIKGNAFFTYWDISAGVTQAKKTEDLMLPSSFQPHISLALPGGHFLFASILGHISLCKNDSRASNFNVFISAFEFSIDARRIANLILFSPKTVLVVTDSRLVFIGVATLLKKTEDMSPRLIPDYRGESFLKLGITGPDEEVFTAYRLNSGELLLNIRGNFSSDAEYHYFKTIIFDFKEVLSAPKEIPEFSFPILAFSQFSDGRLLALSDESIIVSLYDDFPNPGRDREVRKEISKAISSYDIQGVICSYVSRFYKPSPRPYSATKEERCDKEVKLQPEVKQSSEFNIAIKKKSMSSNPVYYHTPIGAAAQLHTWFSQKTSSSAKVRTKANTVVCFHRKSSG